MSSEKFICVRIQRQSSKSALKIFDFRKGLEISEKPITADAAVMNPNRPHLALRAAAVSQVFDIDTKERIASIQSDFPIFYWAWIDQETLGIVSDQSVYTWKYAENASQPQIWFEKSSSLVDAQIISLTKDTSGDWGLLSGIFLKERRILGALQLFNRSKNVSQLIEGYFGCFFQFQSPTTLQSFDLFAFVSFSAAKELKVHISCINSQNRAASFSKRVVILSAAHLVDNDFPISMVFDKKSKFLVIHTKFGHELVCDPESAACISSKRKFSSPLYLITPSLNSESYYVFQRSGEVMKADINAVSLIREMANDHGPESFASLGMVINRLPLDEQKLFYRDHFNNLKNTGKFEDALKLLSGSGKAFLRTFEYMTMIKEFPLLHDSPALLVYFAFILELGELNDAESIELAQLAIKKGKLEILRRWLDDNKVHCSEHLGDLIFDSDLILASSIYERAHIHHKLYLCAAAEGNMELVQKLQGTANVSANVFLQCLSSISKHHSSKLKQFLQLSTAALVNCRNKDFFMALLKLEGLDKGEIARLVSNLSDSLISVNDADINRKALALIMENDRDNLVPFLEKAGPKLDIDCESLLPIFQEKNLPVAAFMVSRTASEAIAFVDGILEAGFVSMSVRLPSSEIVKLINQLAALDLKKYLTLCAALCKFVDPGQYNAMQSLILDHVDDIELKFDILQSWIQRSDNKDLAANFFNCAMEGEKWKEIESICAEKNIQDPESTFSLLSRNEKCISALNLIAGRFNLELRLFRHYGDNSQIKNLESFVAFLQPARILSLLPDILKLRLEKTCLYPIIDRIRIPELIEKSAEVLADMQDQSAMLYFLRDNDSISKSAYLLTLKAKALCREENAIELLLNFMDNYSSRVNMAEFRSFGESKYPDLMLELYQKSDRFDELLSASFKFSNFYNLIYYLITCKDPVLWKKALAVDESKELFQSVMQSSLIFEQNDQVSCLLKILASDNRSSDLIDFLKVLSENPRFSQNRAIQTLLMLNLLRENESEFSAMMDSLEFYNREEVVHACLESGKFTLALKILKKHKLWVFAFKVALFGCNDLLEAESLCELCGQDLFYKILAEYAIMTENLEVALKYALMSKSFAGHQDLLSLLQLNKDYLGMLKYLEHVRANGLAAGPVYDKAFFLCYLKLEMRNEMKQFLTVSNTGNATDMGNLLLRHGWNDVAIICFQRSGAFEQLAQCHLELGNIKAAVEAASKSKNDIVILRCFMACIRKQEFDLAASLAIVCLSRHKVKEVFDAYEQVGAIPRLIDVCDTYFATNPPNGEVIYALGRIDCLYLPNELEAFIMKHHSLLSSNFATLLSGHRRWKELFRFHILRSEFERALELIFSHPIGGFDHRKMFALISKVSSKAFLDKAINYFYMFDPKGLIDLQFEFKDRLDLSAFVSFCKANDILWVLEELLKQQQTSGSLSPVTVNALHEIYIANNDYYGLLESIKRQPNMDLVQLNKALKASGHRHFRVLAAKLAANSGGSMMDALKLLVHEDAVVEILLLLSQTSIREFSEALISRYGRSRNSVMFLAVGYVLFDQIRMDILLEWSQRAQFAEISLPLLCQMYRNRFP